MKHEACALAVAVALVRPVHLYPQNSVGDFPFRILNDKITIRILMRTFVRYLEVRAELRRGLAIPKSEKCIPPRESGTCSVKGN
jgi:hypothetical protein